MYTRISKLGVWDSQTRQVDNVLVLSNNKVASLAQTFTRLSSISAALFFPQSATAVAIIKNQLASVSQTIVSN